MQMYVFLLACVACMGHGRRVATANAFNPSGHKPSGSRSSQMIRANPVKMEKLAELKDLAFKLNPVVGFWDPLNLANYDQWRGVVDKINLEQDESLDQQEATIGFLRHAEIKHGRVAMAAFIGYCVQANGYHWPGKVAGATFESISAAGGPPDQWDALPTKVKLAIILLVGALEWAGENKEALDQSGLKHYLKGGKPGAYPRIQGIRDPVRLPIPGNLWDPIGAMKDMSPEAKERGRLVEISNGRLAMLGIFGFLAESKIPGSVPAISQFVKPYAGEIMAPFNANDVSLPFVQKMLETKIF